MKTNFHITFAKVIGFSLIGLGNCLFTSPALSKEPDCINYMVGYRGSAQCFDDNLNPIPMPTAYKYINSTTDRAVSRRSVTDSKISSACETLSNTLSKSEYESIKSCLGKYK